jgi:beta-galactosidase
MFLYFRMKFLILCFFIQVIASGIAIGQEKKEASAQGRQRISINNGWRFMRYSLPPDTLMYAERSVVANRNDNIVADTRASDSIVMYSDRGLKKWILPTANDFINDPAKKHQRPAGSPGADFPFVQYSFDDKTWEDVNLPHDWAIREPFYSGDNPVVGGGMGRLPTQGIAWYRRKLDITAADSGKSIYLDIDGAMSYAMVWLNGQLVGGWPNGYSSFRLNLTPFVQPGGNNQLAVRVDNPNHSSRWYTGGGLYRNVWLIKTDPVHVAQWGSFVRTKKITDNRATLAITIDIENTSGRAAGVRLVTAIYALDNALRKKGVFITASQKSALIVPAGDRLRIDDTVSLANPLLWGPPPAQKPHLYAAVTRLFKNGRLIDEYETHFGIRSLQFDPLKGLLVNDRPVRMQGVNQHHDLGALGAAFNTRAAERQLQLLQAMGCNAIRMSHNPPAPELLELTDRMGFLVIDEIFDCWEKGKTPLDFHLVFPDWYEPDTRSFIRRDKNHPSVIAWSFGNEVGEQYTDTAGAAVAKRLYRIVKEEDSTRPATASMNYAKAPMPFPAVMDIISLNYQGEGIRDAAGYAHLKGIRTPPQYPAFKEQFPNRFIFSSESASTLSTRGTYLFPVVDNISAPVGEGTGGNAKQQQVSAYELYTAAFGSSPDKVFTSLDKNPYVGGEFVWTGWDYIGEPTPYYTARSSYSGIIDLAGFKKDRFWLYQSRWMPALKMAHILPHWTWPERLGQNTPVHVFSNGDEAELFLNGFSQGKKKKQQYEYRFRWDSVLYQPGTLRVKVYKNGKPWAGDTVTTAGDAALLELVADRSLIKGDANDLSFITVRVTDSKHKLAPRADNAIQFSISGPGEIVATDNGNPADLVSFSSTNRHAFNGMALLIVRAHAGASGQIKVKAISAGLAPAVAGITVY